MNFIMILEVHALLIESWKFVSVISPVPPRMVECCTGRQGPQRTVAVVEKKKIISRIMNVSGSISLRTHIFVLDRRLAQSRMVELFEKT